MKKNLSVCIGALSFFAALTIPLQTLAQQPRYRVIDMGTLGGAQSYLNPGSGNDFGDFTRVLNSRGIAVGFADTAVPDPFPNFCFSDCNVGHAFWAGSNGQLHDIGALLGGGTSLPTWISDNGLVVGFSENGELDPLYAGLPQLRAVLWQKGKIYDLGTLGGGFQSEANAVNSAGQVVGASTTTVLDTNSMQSGDFNLWGPLDPAYAYQMRAFFWDKGNGIQDLGTLSGGTNARALLINERGQVVGHSYTRNSNPSPFCNYPLATDSFIWEKDKGMVDLGGLGGTCTLAFNLNQAGQIVGSANLEGDQQSHAFLWERGVIRDLGGSLGGSFTGADSINELGETVGFATLPGDATFHATLWRQVGELTDLGVIDNDQCSYATGINIRGQVVGTSLSTCDPDTGPTRAFLWEHGKIFDLNTLIPSGSPLQLLFVETINDRGEIAGTGVDGNNNEHAFLLVPCGANGASDCQEEIVGSAQGNSMLMQQPQPGNPGGSIRQMLRRGLGPVPRTLPLIRGGSRTQSTSATEAVASLQITSSSPPSGTVGKLYDFRCSQIPPCNVFRAGFPVTAAGGVPPYSWSWTAQLGSSLPPGLIFPDLSGQQCLNVRPPAICGKPTRAGTYNVVVTVKDSESPPRHASKSYTIHIFP